MIVAKGLEGPAQLGSLALASPDAAYRHRSKRRVGILPESTRCGHW